MNATRTSFGDWRDHGPDALSEEYVAAWRWILPEVRTLLRARMKGPAARIVVNAIGDTPAAELARLDAQLAAAGVRRAPE